MVLHGLAIQKLSRPIAKDKVTSFVRAPFTRFQETSGQGEVEEAARGLSAMWAAPGIADGVQLAYSAGEMRT